MRLPQPYADALDRAVIATTPTGPEMIGVHLAKMCVEVTGVDGAGISLFSRSAFRTPIGASSPTATTAERLQFTVGEGPCLNAHTQQRPVFASEDHLARTWPTFHHELATRSPFHSIISLPLGARLSGLGTIDLYLLDAGAVATLSTTLLEELADIVAEVLADRFHTSMLPDHHSDPPTPSRQMVSIAMGMLTVAGDLTFPDALAVLRAHAFATEQDIDQLSTDLVTGRTTVASLDLRSAP